MIELNDLDYSVDESGDEEGEERELRVAAAIRTTSGLVRRREQGHRRSERERVGGKRGLIERGLVALVGSERSDRVEGFVRQITGLTPVEEGNTKSSWSSIPACTASKS